MAYADDVETDDDELPPLVGSGGGPIAPSSAKKPSQAIASDDDDDDDDDELPPLVTSTAQPASAAAAAKVEPKNEVSSSAFGLGGGLGSGKKAGMIPASSPAEAAAPEPMDDNSVERIRGKDDLDDAIDVLEDGHAEEAELLAGEVRRQAAANNDAEREADALRIETKAQIRSAKDKGQYGRPDSQELDRALRAAKSEAAAFGRRGEHIAQAMMLLAQAEVHLADELTRGALENAEDALIILEEERASNFRLATARHTLADVYYAQQRYHLVVQTAKKVLSLIGESPNTMAEARETAAALLLIAKARESNNEPGLCIKPAEQAAALCERMGDPRGSATASCYEALGYLANSGGHLLARRAAMRAVALSKEAGDIKIEAKAWLAAGLAYSSVGIMDEALKANKQALSLSKESNDMGTLVSSIDNLMSIHASERHPDKAASVAEEELMNAKKVGDRRREGYAQLKMASAMAIQDRPREAVRRAQDGADKLRQIGDRLGEARAMQTLVEMQIQSKRNVEALRSAREAEKLLIDAGMVKNAVAVLQMVTSLHMETGNGHEAMKAAYQQVSTYKDVGFKEEEAFAMLGLSDMVSSTKGQRESLRLCKDAADIFRALDDPLGESQALQSVSSLHLQLKSVSSAMESAKRSDELARKSGDAKAIMVAQQALAEAYVASDDIPAAVSCAKEMVDVVSKAKLNDDKTMADTLTAAAQVQLQIANYDATRPGQRSRPRGIKDAQKNSEEALKLWRGLGDKQQEAQATQRVFQVHLLVQDGANAMRWAREYYDIAQTMPEKYYTGSAFLCLSQAHFLLQNFEEAVRNNEESQAIFRGLQSKENVDICLQFMQEIKAEMSRGRRPAQPMGRPQSVQGGYGSSFDQRGQNSLQGSSHGVPAGGFGGSRQGVPAGGFSGSISSNKESTSRPEKSSLDNGLRGIFTREKDSPRKTTNGSSAGSNWGPTSNLRSSASGSSYASSNSGCYSGGLGGSRLGNAAGSSGTSSYTGGGGYGARSTGGYSSSSQGVPAGGFGGSRGVPSGGFGGNSSGSRPCVPAGGFGGNSGGRQGVPAGGFGGARQGVPAGGFGGSTSGAHAAQDKPSRNRSAFAAFGGARGEE
eukprot:TRINITY_DN136_c0_g2_i1.p1 TRINITY_DN136_c0_g2~~TRINITY_DN136_c0_g2_i1.p1  ORF type:complete len:1105 (+),score=278.92 TRINITY_DN136_c0_g2_i1:29-3343(+)